MAIDITILRAAGLTSEQIVAVLEAEQKIQGEKRRRQNRVNQKNHRSRHQSCQQIFDDSGKSCHQKFADMDRYCKQIIDNIDKSCQQIIDDSACQQIFDDTLPSPPNGPPSPLKEGSPTPPKEITPLPPLNPPLPTGHFGQFFQQVVDWPSDYRETFWNAYPNKIGKADALKRLDKIARARDGPPFEELMGALARYVAKRDDRPWCNPATWLNQHRWLDEPAKNDGKRTVSQAADDLLDRLAQLDEPPDVRNPAGKIAVRRIPP